MSFIRPTRTAVFDGDAKNRSLASFYATVDPDTGKKLDDPLTSVGGYDFNDERRRKAFTDSVALVGEGVNWIFHDLPGGSLDGLMQIADGGKGTKYLMDLLDEYKVRLTLILGLDVELEAMKSAMAYMKAFGNRCDYIVALNMRESSAVSDFPYYYGYKLDNGEMKYGGARKELFKLGGAELAVPVISAWTRSRMNAEFLTFRDATASRQLTALERRHVIRFRDEFRTSVIGEGEDDEGNTTFNDKTLQYLGLDGSDQPRLIAMASLKGGVGKSFAARALVDLARSDD